MAKWFGKIGYIEEIENTPGVWLPVVTERSYYGDVLRQNRTLQTVESSTNDGVNINNQISIIADAYAKDHIYAMRYIEFQNSKWKVTNVDVQPPRLILQLGGIYNGDTTGITG